MQDVLETRTLTWNSPFAAVSRERMSPVVLVVFCIGACPPPFPWRFILSPSATLRVAGLAPWVKVEHTTV